MKLFNTAAAMLMLAMSVLLSNGAMAQSTEPEANCSVLYTDSAVEVGAVCVTVNQDDENVFLDYLLIDDWKLSEANAWIGDNTNIPTDGSGNPQVSTFPHSASNLGDVNQHSFEIPFAELSIDAGTFCSADVIVAASAVVTRTIAGEPDGGGKSDKSGKSGKSGQSDKSGKSGQSDKSGKSGQSDKSDKSDKSVKNSKAGKGSKGNSSAAKNGKGSSQNGTSSWASNGKSDKSGQSDKSGKSGQSDKSGKSGQSGKSDKSGKSGKSGGHNGGGTDPVTETFTAWAGENLVGNGSYFSFSNDFCGPEEPPLITLPNTLCYNVYASFPSGSPVAFSPVGLADAAQGWLNTLTVPGGASGQFLRANGTPSGGNFTAVLSPTTIRIVTTAPANYEVAKLNMFVGAVGSFNTASSPLAYGTSITGGALGLVVNLASPLTGSAEVVAHAIMCPIGTGPYQ